MFTVVLQHTVFTLFHSWTHITLTFLRIAHYTLTIAKGLHSAHTKLMSFC